MHLPSGLRSFLIHLGIFLVAFLLVTGLIGPGVVSSRLLYGFHFFIYGNLGKMVIYSAIVFLLLARSKYSQIPKVTAHKLRPVFFGLAVLMIPIFLTLGRNLLAGGKFDTQIPMTILAHLVLISIPAFLALSIFGTTYLLKLLKLFKKELVICLILAVIFDLAIFQVWKLWPYFSGGVLIAVKELFTITHGAVRVIPPYTLFVEKFGVQIAEACSGIESLFLFSTLYTLIGVLEWNKFNKLKYLLFFPIAALGVYLVNILRVYLLILIGVEISPELALKLFHTYAGMIFFMIYFGLFMYFVYPKLKK